MAEAGINTDHFKAHSTRSASVSKAYLAGVSISEIMQQAHWAKEIPLPGIGLTVDADVEHLPEAVPQGNFKPVPAGENTTFIVFDLETTDLVRGGKYPHITQIAASVVGSVSEFSAYVYPKVPIASTAQQITGIIVNNSGTMTVHGQKVHAEDLYSSIDKFCKWLKKYPSVYLIAHNGRKFDFPVLMNAMMNIKCDRIS
ncbi:uncharacterized protein LOC134269118 [Saccostrea cucullata]|uniref:uncharacterized protein LOC134269118 n=1 Tax=Saccostrea cuccullata TaxID=36930 RepID=UPI002ED66F61